MINDNSMRRDIGRFKKTLAETINKESSIIFLTKSIIFNI